MVEAVVPNRNAFAIDKFVFRLGDNIMKFLRAFEPSLERCTLVFGTHLLDRQLGVWTIFLSESCRDTPLGDS